MAAYSVTHWQLLLQEGETIWIKTKTISISSVKAEFLKAKGRDGSLKAKGLLIYQSRVLEAERAFKNL